MSAVSHETMAVRHTTTRRYTSPKRGAQAAATKRALLLAVLALIAEGQFRASSRHITDRAEVHHGAINYHYGHESLFYRVVAREHWREVAASLPLNDIEAEPATARKLVWAILVGEPMDRL